MRSAVNVAGLNKASLIHFLLLLLLLLLLVVVVVVVV
jgi:hypothetical protein